MSGDGRTEFPTGFKVVFARLARYHHVLSGFHPTEPSRDRGDALFRPLGALVAMQVQPKRSALSGVEAWVITHVERMLERSTHVPEVRRRPQQIAVSLQHVGR